MKSEWAQHLQDTYDKGKASALKDTIAVEVVNVGTHETKDGGWYASFVIVCEDETLDELDDLPRYAYLTERNPNEENFDPDEESPASLKEN